MQYIYTNSKHKNPLRRVVPVSTGDKENIVTSYDKEKYCDLLLDAAETVLGYFGLDPTIYGNNQSNNKKRRWWDELRKERIKDSEAERDN